MPKKVLIIDDDLYIRDLYSEILSEDGYEVESAVDGVDGLERIAKTKFDLILLDLMMPKLDGLGVLKALKASPAKSANGPILLLTNLAHDPVVTEAIQNGAKDSLVKADYNPDELVTKVKSYL